MYEAPDLWGSIVARCLSGISGLVPPLAAEPGKIDGDSPDVFRIAAQVVRQAKDDVVELFPFDHLRERPPADGHLHDLLDGIDVDAVASTGPAIDLDLQARLADDGEEADVLDAAAPCGGSPRSAGPSPPA